jgi:hypothetical protein
VWVRISFVARIRHAGGPKKAPGGLGEGVYGAADIGWSQMRAMSEQRPSNDLRCQRRREDSRVRPCPKEKGVDLKEDDEARVQFDLELRPTAYSLISCSARIPSLRRRSAL